MAGKSHVFSSVVVHRARSHRRVSVCGGTRLGPGRAECHFPVFVANLPLFVGVPEPSPSALSGAAVDPEQAEARALVLLNDARRAAGMKPVAADASLRELALDHSRDMASNNFVGHVSPTTGTPDDRLRKSGLIVSRFGENVGAAATPELVHQSLMESPAHRANMLEPMFTHVGIGAEQGSFGVLLTMNFGRRPSAAEVPSTPAQVESAIVALRASKGLRPVTMDPVYRAAAQAGADSLANGEDPARVQELVGSTLQREAARLRASRPASCSFSTNLLELSQPEQSSALLLPTLKRVGVGARLVNDDKGGRLVTLLVFDGVPCVR